MLLLTLKEKFQMRHLKYGYTNEFLSKQKKFHEVVDEFLKFIEGKRLVIHNAEFDAGFINNELKILGLPSLKNKIIDTVSLARKTLGSRIANLDYLCRRFSIDLSERKIHGALLDSHLLAAVYLELLGGKQISMNLKSPTNLTKTKPSNEKTPNVNFLKIKISEEEIGQHKAKMKQIKSPIWEKINY